MMDRYPVSCDQVCFGFEYNKRRLACRSCARSGECGTLSAYWRGCQTLGEALRKARDSYSRWDAGTFVELYADLYQKFFGWRPPIRSPKFLKKWMTMFGRLSALLIDKEIDPVVYITAQMRLCKGSMYANYLSGANAMRRYESFLAWLNDHRADVDLYEYQTDAGQKLNKYYLSEVAVAEEFIADRLSGSLVRYNDFALSVEGLDADWRALVRASRYGSVDDKALYTARLMAAAFIVDGYEVGLSDVIGVSVDTYFDWDVFADFVVGLLPAVRKREKVLSLQDCEVWGSR